MRPFYAIFHPPTPFVEKFEQCMQVGSKITIDGFIPDEAENIEINFTSGPSFEEDTRSPTALYFNPRFIGNEIRRNHYTPTTGWGREENKGFMTLAKGHPFQMMFVVEANGFKIIINGLDFCEFSHRLPLRSINTLQIVGDVIINKLLLHTTEPPGPPTINSPKLPVEYQISPWMGPGKVITILGVPKSFPERFHIDLFNETSGDIMFHLNPRFNPKRCIVRNSYIKGLWGDEQHDTPFLLLMPDTRFSLKIICEPDFYTVLTNEKHFCYFQHRLPPNQVTHIRVAGDLDVNSITFTS